MLMGYADDITYTKASFSSDDIDVIDDDMSRLTWAAFASEPGQSEVYGNLVQLYKLQSSIHPKLTLRKRCVC